jgi:hypothetical protein
VTLETKKFIKTLEEVEKLLVLAVRYVHAEKLLWKVDLKYMENFRMWCWRRLEKNTWTDRFRNEVLNRVKEERIVP